MAMAQADADRIAAGLALGVVQTMSRERLHEVIRAEDVPTVQAALKPIESWLRRRALGGDAIAIRQTERELGRQVRMRGRK